MDGILGRPKINVEIEMENLGVLIVGEKSPLALPLREILDSGGIKINDPQNFNYIFQLGNFEETGSLLEKATASRAKFFLVLDEDQEIKLSKEAEEKTLKFIQVQRLEGKIIKLSGLASPEEAVKKILKVAFSQTPEKIITLTGPEIFWEKSKEQTKVIVNRRFIFWGGGGLLAIFLLTLPITFILANIFLGTWALKNARAAAFSSDFQKGKKEAQAAEEHFATAKNGFESLAPLLLVLGKEDKTREIESWLETGQDLGRATRYLIEVGQEGQKLARLILNQEQGETDELLSRVSADIGLAGEELALIEARTGGGQISSFRKNLINFKNFLGIAPWVLGLEKKRTYLVLFQNNMELRPGGGFIGTIGLLTFTNGKLELKIEDVYTADGQLRGHVEPPLPIKKYLNQAHWYLRDSNWEPDFPSNAQKAAWFLEKELGIRVDGVIGLDLALVKKILDLAGPVDLVDYQEKISQDNLFLKAQIYSQKDFFPGSSQKRDFLSSLAMAIFTKLSTNSNFPWLGLGKAAREAAEEKHLQVYLENDLAKKLMSEEGWGGEIKIGNCKLEIGNCFDDYLMTVEANLGVNKANYFLKREINKRVEFGDNELRSKITIIYENTSPQNISFAGVYKNYLRVLTAAEATLEKIMIDGGQLDPKMIDRETIFGKTSTGFLVEVPPGGKKRLELFYKTPIDTSPGEFVYQLLVQKQPGTEKDSLTIASNFGLSYNGDLSVDRLFVTKLKK